MKQAIKNISKLSTLSIALGFALSAYASTPTPSPTDISMLGQLKALNNNVQVVGNRLQAAAEADARTKAGGANSFDISKSSQANQAAMQGHNASLENALKETDTDILGQFQPMSDNALKAAPGAQNSDAVSTRLIADNNRVNNLTLNLTASDSLYSNDPSVVMLSSNYQSDLPKTGLAKPTGDHLHDNYFNFGSLIQPAAYAPDTTEADAAQHFLTFLTQGYKDPSQAIDYQSFQSKMSEAKTSKDKASLYIQLMNNPKYQSYQLSARTATAQRSVAVNNFQHMIAERTVVKGLGKSANITDQSGKPVTNASPLQVQKYIATHRVNSPSWFTKVKSASPAAVQRETLVVLAEIEAQNYQAHLDRERMLATLSAQSAMTASASAGALAAQASQVNQDINSLSVPSANQNNNSDQNSSSSNNSDPYGPNSNASNQSAPKAPKRNAKNARKLKKHHHT